MGRPSATGIKNGAAGPSLQRRLQERPDVSGTDAINVGRSETSVDMGRGGSLHPLQHHRPLIDKDSGATRSHRFVNAQRTASTANRPGAFPTCSRCETMLLRRPLLVDAEPAHAFQATKLCCPRASAQDHAYAAFATSYLLAYSDPSLTTKVRRLRASALCSTVTQMASFSSTISTRAVRRL